MIPCKQILVILSQMKDTIYICNLINYAIYHSILVMFEINGFIAMTSEPFILAICQASGEIITSNVSIFDAYLLHSLIKRNT